MIRATLLVLSYLITPVTHCKGQVDTTLYLSIGNIDQFVSAKGTSNSLPVLLYLHGGPGNAVGGSSRITSELEKNFIVVHWDQRNSGKTLIRNSSTQPLTTALFISDTQELIRKLLELFHRNKLYLIGHSWGTFLALEMARQHPDLLEAVVLISPMINQQESERMSLNKMIDWARQTGNREAIEELSTVRIPFENGSQLYLHRKWLQYLSTGRTRLSQAYVKRWSGTWLKVFNEASAVNFNDEPAIECPLYIIIGEADLQTSFSLAEDFYNRVQAPLKGFFSMPGAGHSIPWTHSREIQDMINRKVLNRR